METAIMNISDAWDEDGFLGLLRYGRVYNQELGKEFLQNLQTLEFDSIECIPKDTVRILWFIPLFLEWREMDLENVLEENEYKSFISLKNEITTHLEELFGLP